MVLKYHGDIQSVPRIYIGRVVHSKSLKDLEILPKAALGVREDGVISFLHKEAPDIEALQHQYASKGFAQALMIHLKPSEFLFPGMVDTHLHAPQWPNLALGMEGSLREWIENYTDPMEVHLLDRCPVVYRLIEHVGIV
jgi:guanine deaminase